jgi:hypothetical protein
VTNFWNCALVTSVGSIQNPATDTFTAGFSAGYAIGSSDPMVSSPPGTHTMPFLVMGGEKTKSPLLLTVSKSERQAQTVTRIPIRNNNRFSCMGFVFGKNNE